MITEHFHTGLSVRIIGRLEAQFLNAYTCQEDKTVTTEYSDHISHEGIAYNYNHAEALTRRLH